MDETIAVWGSVAPSGEEFTGIGFTSERLGTGRYLISFPASTFDTKPVVLATVQDNQARAISVHKITHSSFEVHIRKSHQYDAEANEAFNFLALRAPS